MNKTKWDGKAQILIPVSVAICPECSAQIEADVYEVGKFGRVWRVNDDGSGLHIQCTKEDISHYNMPYVDWLPLDKPVIDWLNANYDFRPEKDEKVIYE